MQIHIALAFDNNYAEQSIVLITSILKNKKEEKIHFHLLTEMLEYTVKEILLEFKECTIEFHSIDNKFFQRYKKSNNYPVSILWKMILPEIIDVDKLIYIDCDAIVNSSLIELYSVELDENYIAAVEDANGKKYVKKFGLKQSSKFFNSGVMVINCKKWREDGIIANAIKMAIEKTGTRWGYDQTILNQLFEGKVRFLALKWNLQYCPINIWATYDDIEEYKQAIKNSSIIHFVGDFKPWERGLGCFNPKQKDYLKYHKMTPFAFDNYLSWTKQDKLMCFRGILIFIKRYPLFFLRKRFLINLYQFAFQNLIYFVLKSLTKRTGEV